MSDFNVNEYLKDVIIEGNLVKLPLGQLDRKEYMEVKKKLELIGGKWKGGNTQGFVFEQDPKELLDKVCEGENINLKKEFQFFETPEKIADKLVYYADIQNHDIMYYAISAKLSTTQFIPQTKRRIRNNGRTRDS